MGVEIWSYKEKNPHRVKRIMWAIVNAFIFPLVTNRYRKWLLRLFGATMKIHVRIYRSAKIYAPWNLVFDGPYAPVCIGPRVKIYNKAKVEIGSNVVISQDAYICTASHDVSSPSMALVTKPIRICNQTWIAAKATVLPGVTIGEGAVVGACTVVSKDVDPWSIVVGNPARKVRTRTIDQKR